MTNVDPERPSRDRANSPKRLRGQNFWKLALAEGKQFLVLFLYLWILFGLFVLNERIILHKNGIDFASHGFAIFNAFILAKVMLVAEHLNFSRWLDRRPLIYPILHDSLIFAILFIIFHVIEETLVNIIKGMTISDSIPFIGGGGISGIVCVATILFFALIPFFAFRSFNRVLGPERMYSILFGHEAEELRRGEAD